MRGQIRGHGVHKTYHLEGRQVTKEEFDAAFPDRPIGDGSGLSSTPPNVSNGCAVHPRQVQEAIESAKRRGVPTDFQPNGQPIFTSRAHQKAYLKAYGFHNNDGGYGD